MSDVYLPALVASSFGVSTSEARRATALGAVRLEREGHETLTVDDLEVPEEWLKGAILRYGKRRSVQL